jgi:hypothetical protein
LPIEYYGEWKDDMRHGKGTMVMQAKNSAGVPITRSIEGLWDRNTFDQSQTARVTVREV